MGLLDDDGTWACKGQGSLERMCPHALQAFDACKLLKNIGRKKKIKKKKKRPISVRNMGIIQFS